MSSVKKSLRFETDTPSTPDRVIEVARMFSEALRACAEGAQTGEVTLTVANRNMVATVNARDHQAAALVTKLDRLLSSPKQAALTPVGRMVLEVVRRHAIKFPYGSKLLSDSGEPAVELTEVYWEQVSAALGDRTDVVPVTEDTQVHGKVVGVREAPRGQRVRLRLDDDSSEEFAASEEVAVIAARLYLQPVKACVSFRHTDQRSGERIHSLEAFVPEEDVVAGFARARKHLAKRGIKVDPIAWMRERGKH